MSAFVGAFAGQGAMPEANWAWVSVVVERYRAWETSTVKRFSAGLRYVEGRVEEAQDFALEKVEIGKAHAEMAARKADERARATLRRTVQEYPEVAVGGGGVLFACTLGAANGTLLGRAPRRTVLVSALIAFGLQEPLLAKWGDQLVAASGALSTFMRLRCEAAGLLPPPEPA